MFVGHTTRNTHQPATFDQYQNGEREYDLLVFAYGVDMFVSLCCVSFFSRSVMQLSSAVVNASISNARNETVGKIYFVIPMALKDSLSHSEPKYTHNV